MNSNTTRKARLVWSWYVTFKASFTKYSTPSQTPILGPRAIVSRRASALCAGAVEVPSWLFLIKIFLSLFIGHTAVRMVTITAIRDSSCFKIERKESSFSNKPFFALWELNLSKLYMGYKYRFIISSFEGVRIPSEQLRLRTILQYLTTDKT